MNSKYREKCNTENPTEPSASFFPKLRATYSNDDGGVVENVLQGHINLAQGKRSAALGTQYPNKESPIGTSQPVLKLHNLCNLAKLITCAGPFGVNM